MQRTIDLTLSVLATVAAFFFSWPYFRDFEYWPESHAIWVLYFIVGFVLTVYVFYMFMGSLHILFRHSADETAAATAAAGKPSTDKGQQS